MFKKDFWERERDCERYFAEGGPYYFITTEDLDWMLYESREEFITGTNIVSISGAHSGFSIMDDVQMNNHHHFLGSGRYEVAFSFAEELHKAERKFQKSLGKPSLKEWEIRIDPVTTLKAFRNITAYIDRNAYVARLDSMPTGYPWGSASLFFNGSLWLMDSGSKFRDLGGREKRVICRSHNVDLPESYRVKNGMILRSSFIDYHATERLFNSANQYFTSLTRRGEADIEVAAMIGEKIQIPNEEVFQIVNGWFPGQTLRELEPEIRLKAALKMRKSLGSSNRQISQVLRLSAEEVNRLFPKPV